MDQYEVQRIAERAAADAMDKAKSDLGYDIRELERNIERLESRLNEAISLSDDLGRMVADLARVVHAHQEAWRTIARATEQHLAAV